MEDPITFVAGESAPPAVDTVGSPPPEDSTPSKNSIISNGAVATSSAPLSTRRDSDQPKKEVVQEEYDIQDGCQSSAERNIWSVFNPIWRMFVVSKARLPKASDRGADWAGTVGRPDELRGFLGLKNPINRKTVGLLLRCIDEKIVMDGILLCGPAGSGKSALIKAFLAEFLQGFAPNPEALARLRRTRILIVTQDILAGPPKRMATRVKRFFAAKKDRLSDIVPRFVVVDGIESVPAKSQSALVTLIEDSTSKTLASQGGGSRGGGGSGGGGSGGVGGWNAGIRMMLTTRDVSKLTASLRKCVKPVKVQLVDEVDGVKILLRILQRENVGYELLAVKAIFRICWPDLQRCIAVANEVFCNREFLSEENTLRLIAPGILAAREEMRHHVRAWDSLEPLGFCRACTLRPPCQHISEQELVSRGLQRRNELPQRRGPGALLSSEGGDGDDGEQDYMDCQGFVQRGSCRVFNERGRCSLHHPLDVHIVEVPRPRCPQCTIRLPCGHCDYERSRRALETFCEVGRARVQRHVARTRRVLETFSDDGDRAGLGPGMASKGVKAGGDAGSHGVSWRAGAPGTTATTDVGGASLPTTGGQQRGPGSSPTVAASAIATSVAPASAAVSNRKSPAEKKTGDEQGSKPASKNRVGDVSSRGVDGAIKKLIGLDKNLEETISWVRNPSGGMNEFRAVVFNKKERMLFRQCEEAHEEADAASEAYLKVMGRVQRKSHSTPFE